VDISEQLVAQLTAQLTALRARPIDATEKGFGFLRGCSAASMAASRPPLHEAGFTYPLLTLRDSALRDNAQVMAAYCAQAGVDLAPHGKTGMSPELAARQLAAGAWAITVATIGQLRVYRSFGFPRLLLANELVDETGLRWLAAELAADPDFEAYCYVDSKENLEPLIRTFRAIPPRQPFPVLVEIGHADGRTGCRTDEEALAVAKAVADTGVLRVAGVAGFEGSIHGGDVLARVTAFSRRLRALADTLRNDDEEFIVSAGGSTYFDVVTRELTAGDRGGLRVVLRSGAYLYYDHGHYAKVSPQGRGVPGAPRLRPAIELWAQVLSRPEPGLALLGFGRRDAGFDAGLPVPLRTADGGPADGKITALNDQHAFLTLGADDKLAPGDLVCLGISHPCTTLDKWRVIPVVDDDGRVTDVVHTFF
jgi:D-serine deaminase-like pyridoxal phosphate-dependent protein